ncbi:macro domain-containing protein [Nocardia salmonicida]|uniref:macro domain-containing protein n=1 Tax=Nocardia salmonicida TaxID=53431 RepID=UPI003446EB96
MIREQSGDLLSADVEALVNAVNTVGVMGKGIALQFKQSYPEMFREYARAARAGEVQSARCTCGQPAPRAVRGSSSTSRRNGTGAPPATSTTSPLAYRPLAETIERNKIRSVAIPALGCGHGGLDWVSVEPLIRQTLEPLSAVVDVRLFPPSA